MYASRNPGAIVGVNVVLGITMAGQQQPVSPLTQKNTCHGQDDNASGFCHPAQVFISKARRYRGQWPWLNILGLGVLTPSTTHWKVSCGLTLSSNSEYNVSRTN